MGREIKGLLILNEVHFHPREREEVQLKLAKKQIMVVFALINEPAFYVSFEGKNEKAFHGLS